MTPNTTLETSPQQDASQPEIDSSSPVTLFIPCLVDQVLPNIGLAMVAILEKIGVPVRYNPAQTCCGQPAFNAGYRDEARKVARDFIQRFADAETIVCPSGSCTAMVRQFYPHLFAARDGSAEPGVSLPDKNVFEFSEFLYHSGLYQKLHNEYSGRVGFHNSCHSLRELRLHTEPHAVLSRVQGAEIVEPGADAVCCGFGGIFSVKYEAIAAAMAKTRIEMFLQQKVDVVVSNDPGCIMHMRQRANALQLDVEILHLAEFLHNTFTQT